MIEGNALFLENGPMPASFMFISSFPQDTIQTKIGGRMEGESTELWRHPLGNAVFICI